MPYDHTKNLKPIGTNGFSCDHCGKPLRVDDLALCCPDCGAVFCEDCVKDGAFETHSCEIDDD